MLLFALGVVWAETAEPLKVTVLGAGAPVQLWRMQVEAETAEDPEMPRQPTEAALLAWEEAVDNLADRRVDMAAFDALLARESVVVGACAAAAGVPAGTEAAVQLRVNRAGRVTLARPAPGAHEALAGCVVGSLLKHEFPALLHPTRQEPEATYTFRYETDPGPVPLLVDRHRGLANVNFGGGPQELDDRKMSAQYRNSTTYGRALDSDAVLMGVAGAAAWSFDGTEGLYAARFLVRGDTGSFKLRERLKTVLGAPRWDTALKAWYWRGENILWVAETPAGTSDLVVTILDVQRAKAARLVETVPGDPRELGVETGSRLPRILNTGE